MVKTPTANAGGTGSILGSGRSLEKEMATHSSILAWEIPGTEEPGRLQFMWSQKSQLDLATKQQNKHKSTNIYIKREKLIVIDTITVSIVIVGNLNVPLTPMDRSSRKKIRKEIPTLIK